MNLNLDYKKDPDLFNATAKRWAEMVEAHKCGKFKNIKKTKKSQLRNFYDKVLELEQRARHEDFAEILPFVKMLNSKVAYAETRDVVNCAFVEMMHFCISQVNTKEDLKVFKLFFEAVLGFYKGRD
jgi:CRISPR-associated protein Csm2